nr:AAA family ATPase [Halomicroarcula limicola]
MTIAYDRAVNGINWNDLTAVDDLEDSAPIRQNARGSIFELEQSEYETILALEPEPPDREDIEQLRERLTLPSVSISIPDGLYFDDETRLTREIEVALEAGKHIIFTGPPGTGKTKLATHVATLAARYDAVDDYRFTTATADWTAFDTIGGYVPNRDTHGQELLFEPRLFLQCFRDATGVKNEWLVIDELNRADIDKAIGQLFSVLSGDSTELPYERDAPIEVKSLAADADDDVLETIVSSPDTFPVTPAWRLLATMNTYDKASLYELSYAFMRRFAFIHVGVPVLKDDDGELRTSLLAPSPDEPNYASAWLDQSPGLERPLSKWSTELTEVWDRVNEERAIGPAIVHDMVRYIANYDGRAQPEEAFTSALVTHVYPQLEGLRQEKQRTIIEGLCSSDVPVDTDRLWYQASDFLGLPDTRDTE